MKSACYWSAIDTKLIMRRYRGDIYSVPASVALQVENLVVYRHSWRCRHEADRGECTGCHAVGVLMYQVLALFLWRIGVWKV